MEYIHAIKPPIETPVLTPNIIHLFWVILGIIILSMFAYLFYYLWKKRKLIRRKETSVQKENEESKINKYKAARQKLKEAKKYIESGDYKTFHLQASEAVREYLACVGGDNFMDMTTREILKSNKLTKAKRTNVVKFLKSSDLIKFAKANQEKEAAIEAYELAAQVLDLNI